MNFHIMTLFPDMVMSGVGSSITGRAMESGIISCEAIDIRDYTLSKHKKVDDYPYGGGAGMLMQAQPVYDCYKAIIDGINERKNAAGEAITDKKTRVVYLTPQAEVFTQSKAKELALEEDLILLCGHYEGIDERVLEEIVTDYISIGDYVLTGGELAAMVVVDAVSRMVPGVLSNSESGVGESLEGSLLEYPQYSRPAVWEGKEVPEMILSGDHIRVDAYRRIESIKRTALRRPDLLEGANLSPLEREYANKILDGENIDDESYGILQKSIVKFLRKNK